MSTTFLRTSVLYLLSVILCSGTYACSRSGEIIPPDPPAPEPEPVERSARDLFASSGLTATYADGEIMDFTGQRPLRSDKKVGLFYFIQIGSHGYDYPENHNEVQVPKATDINSPYDVNEILKANPLDPEYGPEHACHHWGKPYLGYYVSNDRWVIRKHAQMLSDAGVDVIFFDITNAYHYLSTVNIICDEYLDIRKAGNATPQVSFMINAQPENTLKKVYNDFYRAKPQYSELWFEWEGKPLILCPLDAGYGSEADFFTRRYSWFDTKGSWFGDGTDVWPWGDYYPQTASRESISIMPATHATTGIGRSHNGSYQPENPTPEMSAAGTYFKLQMEQAMKEDPDFVFITGWNEWTAMRFIVPAEGTGERFLGKELSPGDSYFVDVYNHEFSRDIEPVDGGFGDNYYYYMVDFIRRYKGVSEPEAVTETHTISIDGDMSDWSDVASIYYDDIGDITSRDHHGYGISVGRLTDDTGRNDIIETRVTTDGRNLYFYVETASDITPSTDPMWMRLFIDVKGSGSPTWEGFSYLVNNNVIDKTTTTLQKSEGDGNGRKRSI